MIILSHRGLWKEPSEKNTPMAFERSFSLGFGTEPDIRDYKGELVISHDIANINCISAKEMFEIYNKYDNTLPLALNIKSDGLQVKLKELLKQFNITKYFVFDMSVPDGLQYINHQIRAFTRQSEYELEPSFYSNACGIWLDEFNNNWIDYDILNEHLQCQKNLCIVSPELHGRDYLTRWEAYKLIEKKLRVDLMICTDFPERAKEYFNA